MKKNKSLFLFSLSSFLILISLKQTNKREKKLLLQNALVSVVTLGDEGDLGAKERQTHDDVDEKLLVFWCLTVSVKVNSFTPPSRRVEPFALTFALTIYSVYWMTVLTLKSIRG